VTTRRLTLRVNGADHEVEVDPRTLLSDVLRHELGLTGTHVGCEQGACGACTVLADGRAVRSCLVLAPQAEGLDIETVESIGPGAGLHPVQQALADEHGLQCGFCTPGIVVSLVAAARAGASEAEAVDDVLGGHLCRCTGYVNIRAAVRAAWPTVRPMTEPVPEPGS
jgi:aerobic-type carbon monoxide dehydrogenase small subunit (CoxS/CutS family)